MYEVKGFIFHTVKNEVHKFPINNIPASTYEEVHEAMQAMGIDHYMFVLKEVRK